MLAVEEVDEIGLFIVERPEEEGLRVFGERDSSGGDCGAVDGGRVRRGGIAGMSRENRLRDLKIWSLRLRNS